METDKKMRLLVAVAARLIYHDLDSPNSARLQRRLARFMCHPAFHGQGFTVRDLRDLYVEISEHVLDVQASFRRR